MTRSESAKNSHDNTQINCTIKGLRVKRLVVEYKQGSDNMRDKTETFKSRQAVGYRIRDLRESLRYSREAFAEKAEISADFLYDIETAKKDFTTAKLSSICRAFSVSADFILFGQFSQSTEAYSLLNKMNHEQLKIALNLLKALNLNPHDDPYSKLT